MSEFPKPSIPLLQANDTIDLEQLDGDLMTYVKYPGIALGDLIFPAWRGCGQDSQAHDLADDSIEVDAEQGYSEALGMPVRIRNDLMGRLDQGWALYSYSVARQAGERGPESLRQFCYVGVRPPLADLLPVAQMRDAHDLALDPDAVVGSSTLAVVPPYQAMRPQDKVTLTFAGYYDDELDDEWVQSKTLAPADIGRPLTWQVPKGQLSWIEGGHAEVGYQVDYASGGHSSRSALQTFQIRAADTALLPAPQIDGHDDDSLDPGHFPDGLLLRIEPWSDIREGDHLLLHWLGEREADSVIKTLRVDTSMVDSGIIEVLIEAAWLQASVGGEVQVFYQYAREGAARSSERRLLAIRAPLNLLPPIIDKVTAEGGAGENKGVLEADESVSGAYVNVPDSVPLHPGDLLEVHWDGHPAGGKHVAATPVSGQTRRFYIPPGAIAANMASGETRRFAVFYRLTPEGEPPLDSVPFNLRIEPTPRERYGSVQCLQAHSGALHLSEVPAAGADLTLGPWRFLAEGQHVTIQADGVGPGGQPVSQMVRSNQPLTAAEATAKQVEARLVRMFLTALDLGQVFTLSAKVSFDGGETTFDFQDLRLPLRP